MGLNTETCFDFRLSFIILAINVDQIHFVLSFDEDYFKGQWKGQTVQYLEHINF